MPSAGPKQQRCEAALSIPTARELQITPGGVMDDFGQICVAIPASGAMIAVRELAGLRCTVTFGNARALGTLLPMDSAFTRQCMEAGEVVVCEDTESDPTILPSAANGLSFRSAVAVPMHANGSIVGLIEVFCSQPSAIDLPVIAGLVDVAKSFAALLIFDADNGGQPLIAGPREHPAPLPALTAAQEPDSAANPDAELAELIEEPETQTISRRVARTSQLPSDRPIPARVWLIAGALLLGFSLLFLALFLLTGS
jgi:hypothetical protein